VGGLFFADLRGVDWRRPIYFRSRGLQARSALGAPAGETPSGKEGGIVAPDAAGAALRVAAARGGDVARCQAVHPAAVVFCFLLELIACFLEFTKLVMLKFAT